MRPEFKNEGHKERARAILVWFLVGLEQSTGGAKIVGLNELCGKSRDLFTVFGVFWLCALQRACSACQWIPENHCDCNFCCLFCLRS